MNTKRCVVEFLIFCCIMAFCWPVYAQSRSQRPNILVMVADDLTFSDIEPYGSQQVRTPAIARLASEGVCLDNMFTATAMCAPTRQQLLTGLFPVRNGAYPNHSEVYEGTKSMAHYLQELGYRTGLIGKRHFGPQSSFPFDYLGGHDSDHGEGRDIPLERAEKYIRESGETPFLLMVTFNQPHVPWNRGNPAAYPPESIALPPGFEDTELTRESMSAYFAEISYLDSLVGECLHILERTGKKEETVVIFTSEQGAQLPFGKFTCYDQGLKTAFITSWPGQLRPGTRSDALLQYVDVVPTLIELAGGDPQNVQTGNRDAQGNTGFDGRSFLSILQGAAGPGRDYAFGVHTTRGINKGSDAYAIRSVRDKNYLYIRNLNHEARFSNVLSEGPLLQQWKEINPEGRALFYVSRPAEELYDVRSDPFQLHNLAGKKELDPVKRKLNRQLELFMEEQGDQGIQTEMRANERQPKHTANQRPTANPEKNKLIAGSMKVAEQQAVGMLEKSTDVSRYPRTVTPDGAVAYRGRTDWTSGFWPGCLWYLYELTDDAKWKRAATEWTESLEQNQYFTEHHDIGFMMYCSYGNGLRLTGNTEYIPILIQSARSLLTRYSPVVGSIRSWNTKKSMDGRNNWEFPVIMDNMMNLELLFFAYRQTGDTAFRDAAVRHAETTLKNHVRPDYSSYHVVNYNPLTGQVLHQQTMQGFSDKSTWARGQAWAIYGFTMVYRETKDRKFLIAARKMADFFLNHPSLPDDKVPIWDFNVGQVGYHPDWNFNPSKFVPVPRDASAAAITASALLELCTYVDGAEKNKYYEAAADMLRSLASDDYLAAPGTNHHFLLKHSVGNMPKEAEVNVPLIYADYYFLEALLRYKGLKN